LCIAQGRALPAGDSRPTTSQLALRNDVDVAVVQGLPDAQIEVDFQAGLLLVKFMGQTDTQQVVR
jgi:hypothetical protein